MSILNFVGRAALASIFIQGGLSALQHPQHVPGWSSARGCPSRSA
ncbi:hypothetical protein [Deinococcus rubellus]|uniref:Uncharacterized protein n=1 Tax=Deinococcus rubellus TaxID=1889240 RepID=A0ABY5YG88_9DEIO|nr:hypothetical protein [Deinococcus rubellus]UWX64100.1 hypothetical protein N0D28_00005 [Deinococcus rubellus]